MQPSAWIIESADGKIWMTFKADVAAKQERKGAIVTPYYSKLTEGG